MDNLKGHEIKYITVELIQTDAKLKDKADLKDLVKYGQFKGISAGTDFALIEPQKSNTTIVTPGSTYYKMSMFNVLSLEVYDGASKHIVIFKHTDEDQTAAMKILSDLTDKLKEANRLVSKHTRIINTTTYTDLPNTFGTFTTTQTTKHTTIGCSKGNHSTTTTKKFSTKYIAPADRKATLLQRKTKKPHHATIKKLSRALDEIENGDYVYPGWKKTDKEISEPFSKNDTKPSTINNYGYGY